MRLARAQQWWQTCTAWEKVAVLTWITGVLVVSGRGLIANPRCHSVYPVYVNTARNWIAGKDLYFKCGTADRGNDYRYSPSVAAAMAPFTILPDRLSGCLWRLINVVALIGAVAWWTHSAAFRPLRRNQFAALLLLLLPLSLGNIHNGQSNPLVLALLLASVASVSEQRWNLASLCITIACLFKVYPIALGLLLVALYPRQLAGRLILTLTGGLLVPFLLQRPDYVVRQYSMWLDYLLSESRDHLPVMVAYRDLRLLLRVWFVPLSPHAYLAIQLVSAAVAALVCRIGQRRGWPSCRLLTLLLGLGCCWMTVLGVATESATYILVGPTVAWAMVEAWLQRRSLVVRGLVFSSYGLLLAAQLANWFPGSGYVHALGVQPLATLILIAGLLAAEAIHSPTYKESDLSEEQSFCQKDVETKTLPMAAIH